MKTRQYNRREQCEKDQSPDGSGSPPRYAAALYGAQSPPELATVPLST